MHRRVPLLALAAVVTAVFTSSAGAHPVLSFDEQSVVQPAKGSNVKAGSRTSSLQVTLGHQYLSIDSAGSRDIVDFRLRRLYHVDLRKRTFERSSLFAMVGFALLESQNRLALNRVLDAALPDDSRTPAMVAQLFSIAVKGADVPIDATQSAGNTVISGKAASCCPSAMRRSPCRRVTRVSTGAGCASTTVDTRTSMAS